MSDIERAFNDEQKTSIERHSIIDSEYHKHEVEISMDECAKIQALSSVKDDLLAEAKELKEALDVQYSADDGFAFQVLHASKVSRLPQKCYFSNLNIRHKGRFSSKGRCL